MRIVLDTNVLIAGALNPHGVPGSLVNAILDKRVTVLVDDRILFGYQDVLQRPKFLLPWVHVKPLLEFFEHEGEYVTAGPTAATVPDPGDLPFYEVAMAGGADYLVTGNERRFPKEPFIVSPKAFITILVEE